MNIFKKRGSKKEGKFQAMDKQSENASVKAYSRNEVKVGKDGTSVIGENNMTATGDGNIFNTGGGRIYKADGDIKISYHAGLDLTLTPPRPSRPKAELFGRKEAISEVLKKLNEERIILINGYGGVGKTEFAKSLAAKIDKARTNSGWFEYRDSLDSTFAKDRNIIIGKDAPNDRTLQKEYSDYVKTLLNEMPSDFLLVIDNANPDEEFRSFLDSLNCRVIVTTRSNIDEFEHIEGCDTYTLPLIENEEAQNRIFEHYRGKETAEDEKNAVNELCKRAGGLPIIIELLAGICKCGGLTPQGLLKRLKEKGFNLSAVGLIQEFRINRDGEKLNFEEHIKKLFDIAGLKPELQLLMKQLGAIAPRGTKLDTIKGWLDVDDNALNELRDWHWIEIEETDEIEDDHYIRRVKMHDAVIDTMRALYKPSFEDCEGLIDRLIDEMEGVDSDINKALRYPNLTEVENVADCYHGRERDQNWLGVLNYCICVINLHRGNYVDALKYAKESMEILKAIYGENDGITAVSYNNIAAVYTHLGENEEALKYYKKAIGVREAVLPANYPGLATLYNSIALVYNALGKNEEALKYAKKAIEIREAELPANHPDLAASYSNIANVYTHLGENEEALKYHKKAIGIREAVLPANHPALASSYNNIASVYNDLGENEEALKYHKKAIAIREAVLPANHPDLAMSYSNIANVYGDLGENEEALEYHEKAIAIMEAALPANHPDLAISYNNIAVSYADMEELDAAFYYADKALKIFIEKFGKGHPYTEKTLRLLKKIITALMKSAEVK